MKVDEKYARWQGEYRLYINHIQTRVIFHHIFAILFLAYSKLNIVTASLVIPYKARTVNIHLPMRVRMLLSKPLIVNPCHSPKKLLVITFIHPKYRCGLLRGFLDSKSADA
jgi:hypothetical protein